MIDTQIRVDDLSLPPLGSISWGCLGSEINGLGIDEDSLCVFMLICYVYFI